MVLSGFVVGVSRTPVSLAYALLVSSITALTLRMDPAMHDALIRRASTNLHNLGNGRLGTLVGSAFIVDAGPIYLWLPGLVCLLIAAELLWGSARLLIAFAVGHVGATLLVAAGLAAAVHFDWLSASVARAPDVGMSYGAMAVLGVLTAAIPPRWRPVWLGWWLAAAAAVAATGGSFTDVGHIVALALGMLTSFRFRCRRRWTAWTVVLAALGASFAYVVLSNGLISMLYSAAWGAWQRCSPADWCACVGDSPTPAARSRRLFSLRRTGRPTPRPNRSARNPEDRRAVRRGSASHRSRHRSGCLAPRRVG